MTINKDVVEAIGNTPLIKLKRASEATGCTILGKAEFMNPGQSVKDRAGKWMILEAEKRGELKPGGLVVEATAGNTGIGLAVVASARGYRTLILIPETQSQEKKDMLRLCGAELVEVPALPYANPNNYQHVGTAAGRPACARPSRTACCSPTSGTISTTPRRITNSTGPEIWEQTGGKIDGFICSVGTGGTLAGTSRYLKEKNQGIVIACADPHGFAMYELFKHGDAKSTPGDSITEGIGLGRVTPVIETAKVDDAFLIPDEEAVTGDLRSARARRPVPRRLHRHQCRRRDPARQAARTRQDHRHHPLRFRQPLSVKAVQSGLHALEEPAGAGMAGEAHARSTCRSRRCERRHGE